MEKNFLIKVPPNDKKIPLSKFSFKGWDFYYHSENMLNSSDLDLLTKDKDTNELHISHLPEIFYGYNRYYIINEAKNFCYEFNPLQMLSLTNNTIRQIWLDKKDIYYIPPPQKSQFSKIEDQKSEIDWSFSSPYMGHITSINKSSIHELFPQINGENNFKVEKSEMMFPDKKHHNIINYNQVYFYEDELGDVGFSEGKIGLGVTEDYFIGLLRSYIRVDNMIVRNIDTKLYYKFGDKYIIRSFTVKEKNYDELKNNGFNITNEWNLSPTQSDRVDPFLGKPIFEVNDLIHI